MFETILATTGVLYALSSIEKLRDKPTLADSLNLPRTRRTASITETVKSNVKTVFSGNRRKQMAELAKGRYAVKSSAEARVDRALTLAMINVGIGLCSFLYQPLIWLAVPILVYSYIPLYLRTFHTMVRDKRIFSSYLLDSIMITGALANQYFFLLAMTSWLNIVCLKMIYQSEHSAKINLDHLFGEQPRTAWVLMENGVEREIPFDDLQWGDTIVVGAGQLIPVDGVIKDGFACIDQHKLTGESQPVERGVGDSVLSSTVVINGKIYIEVEKSGAETVAMQIGAIINGTSAYKDSVLSKAEFIADRSMPITAGLFLLALPTLGAHGAMGVLANKPGNKMKEFGPISMLISLNLACKQGALIKDGRSLELLKKVDTVVFDKTGTLTLEQPTVGRIHCYEGISEADILKYAAAAEQRQTHPIAKAILQAAENRGIRYSGVDEAEYRVGYGIHARIDGRSVEVGSSTLMSVENIFMPMGVSVVEENCHAQGISLIYIALDGRLAGIIELHVTIRPEAKRIVDYLHQRNIETCIISGDFEAPTRKLAETLGIDCYFSNILPEQKARLVEGLREKGKSICFVGDGINDTIALKVADVSVSLKGATMIATDTAQIVLMDGTLNGFSQLFEIADDYNSKMKGNFLFATVPSGISLFGIFLFHWGLASALLLSQSALFLGLANSLLPLLKRQRAWIDHSKLPSSRD